MKPYGHIVALILLTCLQVPVSGWASEVEDRVWSALRSGGHVALIRHAIAPGLQDPPGFTLGDCSSQRNLSEKGRTQSARIGERFRTNGIRAARVFSSQWCRCLETARFLDLGLVRELAFLNSFSEYPERRVAQTRMLQEWLSHQNLDQPLVLVTHQVNINALTNVYPGSGALVVIRLSELGELTVVGTIETD